MRPLILPALAGAVLGILLGLSVFALKHYTNPPPPQTDCVIVAPTAYVA